MPKIAYWKGKTLSPEAREKMSKSHIENLMLFSNNSEHIKYHTFLKKFHKPSPQSVNVAQSQSVAESTLTQRTPTPPVK